jgi:hypothetical protein
MKKIIIFGTVMLIFGVISFSSQPIMGPTEAFGQSEVIFDNGNIYSVYNSPTRPTTFSIHRPRHITLIRNYHWNYENGANPGMIGLESWNGQQVFGPWQSVGLPGQGGVPNAYWECYPDVIIPPGRYRVIDSNPGTWAQNEESQGAGMTRIEGLP